MARKKTYTILIMPDATGKFHRLMVSGQLIYIVVGIVGAVLFASIFFFGNYIQLSKEVGRLRLDAESAKAEKAKVHVILRDVEELKEKMAKLRQFDRKLRVIADLENIDEQFHSLGMGGPALEGNEINPKFEIDPKDELVSDLQNEMDALGEQMGLQEDSFLQLIEFLEDKKALLRSTPSVRPTRGFVSSGFGYRKSPFTGGSQYHEGIDIATRPGTPVVAPADGIVILSGKEAGFGNVIEIDHGNGFITRFAHNSTNFVKKGDRVRRGQVIGTVGNSGRSTGPHLHYEVLLNNVAVNPLKYILD